MRIRAILFIILSILIATQNGEAQRRTITIFLAGDSTMAQKLPEKRPETGWGRCWGSFSRTTR